jgi:SlyX protein
VNPAVAGFFIRKNIMNEDRLVELETKLAFQETTIHKLDEVVAQQQNQLDILQAAIQELHERMKSMAEETVRDPADEPPPPHY